jgi:DnaA family protein
MKQLALGVRLRADAVFESFAPGLNTELVAALRSPGAAPLWLWGGHGSGKTHLLQATCAAAGETAAYFPLDRSSALPPAALVGFENCRVLCLDDVDAVAGDLAWEQALFRLFNAAADLRTRLIFAAGAAPRALEWSLNDWRSRAAACVVYQLRDLDEAGRVEALRLRAAQRLAVAARDLRLPAAPDAARFTLAPRHLGSPRRSVIDRAAPLDRTVHSRRAGEARKNKTIVQNQANTNNRLMEATQRAAGFTKSSVRANVI